MDDETILLDLDRMTLGELEAIEDIAGADAVKAMMAGQMTAKALIAVAYVVKRRDHPGFTLEDARALRVVALKQPDDSGKVEGNGA